MNLDLFFIVSIVLIFSKTSEGNNNTNRINEGASTSSDLNKNEKCEIFGYAESVVNLMLAEDSDGSNLTDIMADRFYELDAFHNEVFSNFLLAEYGAKASTDETRRFIRTAYFSHFMDTKIMEILTKACTHHHRHKLSYSYDSNRHAVLLREINSFPSENCLCENFEERRILDETVNIPVNRHPNLALTLEINNDEVTLIDSVQYHIIPLSLIAKFFNVWLSINIAELYGYNLCTRTLIGRLKRSIQKLVIVRTRNAVGFSNNDPEMDGLQRVLSGIAHSSYQSEMDGRAYNWLKGNIFLGPPNRGPYFPGFEKNDDEFLSAFESNVGPIIGERQFRDLKFLFDQLHIFINEASSWQPHEMLINGFKLFIILIFNLNDFDITPLNLDQWELREPTDEELRNVTEQARRELRSQKFWAIKKRPRRSPRSNNYNYDQAKLLVSQKLPALGQLKFEWSEFILRVMKISVDARSRNKTLSWSCNLTRSYNDFLYAQYQLHATKRNFANCSAWFGFGDFLYSFISKSYQWQICSQFAETNNTSEWCRVWKRISLNLNKKDFFIENNNNKNSQSELHDIKIFMQWFFSNVNLKNCGEEKPQTTTYLNHLYLKPEKSVVNIVLCYLTTFPTSIFYSYCRQTFGNKKLIYPLGF